MRYPTDIQKIEREKRQKKCEELRIQRKMKSPISTRPKDLPELIECRPVERKGEVLPENSTEMPKDLSESRESQPKERKHEASSTSSMVGVVQIESTTSKIMSNMIVQNQELVLPQQTMTIHQ